MELLEFPWERLKSGFAWMLPHAQGKQKWTHNQIKNIHFEGFAEMAEMVTDKYTDVDISGLTESGGGKRNAVFLLTGCTF